MAARRGKRAAAWLGAAFLAAFVSASFAAPSPRLLAGLVTDRVTRTPLAGARISLLGGDASALTGADGAFRMDGLPEGPLEVLFEKDGYIALVRRVAASTGTETRLDAALEPLRRDLTVTAESPAPAETASSSRRELGGEEAGRLPGTFGDAARAIQVLPGVATSGDFKNDLIVRGGAPSENLFLLDSVQVPGISHFGSQNSSGGSLGLIPPALIEGLEFLSGGVPASYGDKLSSVTRVRLREGRRDDLAAAVDLNLFGAGGTLEGPLPGRAGSWILAGRKDFFQTLPDGLVFGLTVVPDYEDVQAKVVLDLTSRTKLSLLGLWARDGMDIEDPEDPAEKRMTIGLADRQRAAGATLQTLLGRRGLLRVTAARTDWRYSYSLKNGPQERYGIRSNEAESSLRAEAEAFLFNRLHLLAGLSVRLVEADHAVAYRGGYLVIDRMGFRYTRTSASARLEGSKTAAYLQVGLPLLDGKLRLDAGGRWDRFDLINRSEAAPRLGMSWRLSPAAALRLSYGVHLQSPESAWIASHADNRRLDFLRAEAAAAGLDLNLGRFGRLVLEGFGKRYTRYPVDLANPFLTMANQGGSIVPTYFGSRMASSGSGRSRGLEVGWDGAQGRWAWRLDYSYSRVEFRALDGVLRNGDFDFGHIVNLALAWRPGPGWDLGLRWRYQGGQPYTPFDLPLSTARDSSYFDMTRINTLRYPPFHRLDLRAAKAFAFRKWSLEAFLDVQNVYNRRNIYYRFWDDGREQTVHFLPVVPFLGVRASF